MLRLLWGIGFFGTFAWIRLRFIVCSLQKRHTFNIISLLKTAAYRLHYYFNHKIENYNAGSD